MWAPLVRLCAPVFAKAAGGAGRPPIKVELHAGPIFKKAARDGTPAVLAILHARPALVEALPS